MPALACCNFCASCAPCARFMANFWHAADPSSSLNACPWWFAPVCLSLRAGTSAKVMRKLGKLRSAFHVSEIKLYTLEILRNLRTSPQISARLTTSKHVSARLSTSQPRNSWILRGASSGREWILYFTCCRVEAESLTRLTLRADCLDISSYNGNRNRKTSSKSYDSRTKSK